MAMIWRRASEVAQTHIRDKTPVCALLKPLGWELPRNAEPPQGVTAAELAAWVRNTARPT
jgi:hypothetical protein